MDENKTPVEITEMVLERRIDLKLRKELYTELHGEEYLSDL